MSLRPEASNEDLDSEPHESISDESAPFIYHGEDDNYTAKGVNKCTFLQRLHAFRLTFPTIAIYCLLLTLLLEIFDMILITPQIALFQRSICSRYYRQHGLVAAGQGYPIPENGCQVKAVQQELAIVRGWKGFFDCLPGKDCSSTIRLLADEM